MKRKGLRSVGERVKMPKENRETRKGGKYINSSSRATTQSEPIKTNWSGRIRPTHPPKAGKRAAMGGFYLLHGRIKNGLREGGFSPEESRGV